MSLEQTLGVCICGGTMMAELAKNASKIVTTHNIRTAVLKDNKKQFVTCHLSDTKKESTSTWHIAIA